MGNVKEIGANAFAYCKELKSVTMVIGSGWSWKVGTTTITGLDDAATAAKHLTGEYAGGIWKKTK